MLPHYTLRREDMSVAAHKRDVGRRHVTAVVNNAKWCARQLAKYIRLNGDVLILNEPSRLNGMLRQYGCEPRLYTFATQYAIAKLRKDAVN